MTYLRFGVRLAFGVFLVLHGLAHSPAVLVAWGLATFEDASPGPNVVLNDPGDAVLVLLGAAWLVAAAAFVLAGIGVLWRNDWWPRMATGAALASLVMTTLWWEDAIVGLVVINAGLIVVLGGLLARTEWMRGRFNTHGVASSAA